MFARWFQPAHLVLFFMVLLTLFSAILARGEVGNFSVDQVESGRIIAVENGSFGMFKTYILTRVGVVKADIFKLPPLGKEVVFNGDFKPIDFSGNHSNFDEYERIMGVAGVVDNLWITSIQNTCDIWCYSITNVENARQNIQKVYQKASCQSYKFVIDFLAPQLNCQDVGALSIGLVTGGTKEFTTHMKDSFRTLGLTHLVAVSGFQVVLVMTVIETFFTKFRLRRRVRFALAVIAIFAMIALVGLQPPVLRSSISIILSQLVLLTLGRRVSGLRLLLYSGCIMLLVNPLYLFSASFQLSFLASTGMIMASGQDVHPLPFRIDRFLKDVVVTSVYTFLFTLPVIIALFEKISLLSVLTNIIIIPIIPWVTFANLASLIPFIGQLFEIVVVLSQTILLQAIKLLSETAFFKFFVLEIGSFAWYEIVLYYAALLAIPNGLKFLSARGKL